MPGAVARVASSLYTYERNSYLNSYTSPGQRRVNFATRLLTRTRRGVILVGNLTEQDSGSRVLGGSEMGAFAEDSFQERRKRFNDADSRPESLNALIGFTIG